MLQTKKMGEGGWLHGRLQIWKKEGGMGASEVVGYHENGCLQFCYPLVNGEFEGKGRCWDINEQLVCEESYQSGKLDGMSQEWRGDGSLKSVSFYEKGSLCYQKGWHPNGQLRNEELYRDGKRRGISREWFENGVLKRQLQPGQKYLEWHENGQLKFESSRLNGHVHGLERSWYEDGTPRREYPYVHGRGEGAQKAWYPDGKIKFEYFYHEGRRHGFQRLWSPEGILQSEQYFLRDILVPKNIQKLLLSGRLRAKQLIEIENSAVRRACLEELGYARFLSQVEHMIVDRDGERELVRIRWHPREETLCLVKVKCPSTGAFYTLRVPPQMKSVKDAVSWTFHFKADEYDPIKET